MLPNNVLIKINLIMFPKSSYVLCDNTYISMMYYIRVNLEYVTEFKYCKMFERQSV